MSDTTSTEWIFDAEDGEIYDGSGSISRVYLAHDFPCLDEDDEDYQAIVDDLKHNGFIMAAAKEMWAACEAQEALNTHYAAHKCTYEAFTIGEVCTTALALELTAQSLLEAALAKVRGGGVNVAEVTA